MRMLHNNVLIELISESEKSVGGVLIPDNAQDKPYKGKVLAVGKGVFVDGQLVPSEVSVGDIVMFPRWVSSFTELSSLGDDRKLATIKDTDITAILDKEDLNG